MTLRTSKKTRTTGLTHVDARGEVRMVDVAEKAVTTREASAYARVAMLASTADLIREGRVEKGDVLATVRLAGIMAAKRTSELVPLCHPLALTKVAVEIDVGKSAVSIVSRVRCEGKTGVEMEALTAASVSALTLYDMLKAVDRGITFEVGLLTKSGGKSGTFARAEANGTRLATKTSAKPSARTSVKKRARA
jgi:cyclic pyranopterin phosphate synthase